MKRNDPRIIFSISSLEKVKAIDRMSFIKDEDKLLCSMILSFPEMDVDDFIDELNQAIDPIKQKYHQKYFKEAVDLLMGDKKEDDQ